MKKALSVIFILFLSFVSAFAVAANYTRVAGGGIIVDSEQLNPFNPAGLQFTSNFVQLEVYSTNAPVNNVTDPTGPAGNVMFVFPMILNVKFADILGLRFEVFSPTDTAVIPSLQGNTRMGAHPAAISPFSPIAVSWGMKFLNMGYGLKYEMQYASQGKWTEDNYSLFYMKHKFQPGFRLNAGGMTLDIMGDINVIFLNWSVATTNTTGSYLTNSVVPKTVFGQMYLKTQVSVPVSTKMTFAGRLEGGLLPYGYDERCASNGGNTLTNNVDAAAYTAKFSFGLKYSPIELIDTYFDIGAGYFGQSIINRQIGTGIGINLTNTNAINQISAPSFSLGVSIKPSIFVINLGLSQNIVASFSQSTNSTTLLNTGYELDPTTGASGPFGVVYQGNTLWTVTRTASLGVAMKLNPVLLEATVNIGSSSFLATEISNPLDAFSRIFNGGITEGQKTLFTGLRCSFMF